MTQLNIDTMKEPCKYIFSVLLVLNLSWSYSQEYYFHYVPEGDTGTYTTMVEEQYLRFINDSVFTIGDGYLDNKFDTMKIVGKDWYLSRSNIWYEFYSDSKKKSYSSLEGYSDKETDMNYVEWLEKEEINGVSCRKFRICKSNLTYYDIPIIICGYFNPNYGIIAYLYDDKLQLRSDLIDMGKALPVLSPRLSYHYCAHNLRPLHSFTELTARFDVKFIAGAYKIEITDLNNETTSVSVSNADAESSGIHLVHLPHVGPYLIKLTTQDGRNEFTVIQVW